LGPELGGQRAGSHVAPSGDPHAGGGAATAARPVRGGGRAQPKPPPPAAKPGGVWRGAHKRREGAHKAPPWPGGAHGGEPRGLAARCRASEASTEGGEEERSAGRPAQGKSAGGAKPPTTAHVCAPRCRGATVRPHRWARGGCGKLWVMAKYSPGPGACLISGSVGRTTFTHTRFGSIFKAKMVRYRIPTQEFLRQQSLLSYVAYAWAMVLTPAQRMAWVSYCATHVRRDRCGNVLVYGPYTWFMKHNLPRVRAGLPLDLLPPA